MGTKIRMSIEEFGRLPDDVRYELDEGEPISLPPGDAEHSRAALELGQRLDSHVKEQFLGRVYSRTGFVLGGNTVRTPYVAFVRKERAVPHEGFYPGAPDLAVELYWSPDTAPQLMRKVLSEYFRAGAQAVWVLYPDSRQVHALKAETDRILNADDVLEAPQLLPGFSVRVGEIFE